ncbi:MAG: hypothetical protein V3T05_09290 [Myxococcota bacterium]
MTRCRRRRSARDRHWGFALALLPALIGRPSGWRGRFALRQSSGIDGADPTGFTDPLPSDKSGWGRLRIYAAPTGQDPVANEAPAVA